MDKLNDIKVWIAALIGALTGLWGWMGWLVIGWIACMVLDFITGCAGAMLTGNWASARARDGAKHKLGMVWVVIVSAGADLLISTVLENLPVIELPIKYPGLVCPVVLVWYILTELGSVVENAIEMGAPVPDWLKKLLAIGKDAVDKAGDEMGDDKGGGDE